MRRRAKSGCRLEIERRRNRGREKERERNESGTEEGTGLKRDNRRDGRKELPGWKGTAKEMEREPREQENVGINE